MGEFNNGDVSTSKTNADVSSETKDVEEAKSTDISEESKMDDELSKELDSSYESYMENNKTYTKTEKPKEVEGDSAKTNKEVDSKTDEKNIEKNGQNIDNAENNCENIKCRNENLEGKEHPETGVPFERRQVEVKGKQYEVVVPRFESKYDAQLPEDMYEASDRDQFKESNVQLKNEVAVNKDLREQFDEEQLEQIENGDTPDGYTWHHDAEAGKMQLVDTETHQRTGHTGGRSIWGGGTENR